MVSRFFILYDVHIRNTHQRVLFETRVSVQILPPDVALVRSFHFGREVWLLQWKLEKEKEKSLSVKVR